MEANNTAARSLVRASDKQRKLKSKGKDTSHQDRKVKTATELYEKSKKSG